MSSSLSRSLDGSWRTYRGVSCNVGADAEDVTLGSSAHRSSSTALIGLLPGAIAIVDVVDVVELLTIRLKVVEYVPCSTGRPFLHQMH
jgi:hypothetical protein